MILRRVDRLESGMRIRIIETVWGVDSVWPHGDQIVVKLYLPKEDEEDELKESGQRMFPDDLVEVIQ